MAEECNSCKQVTKRVKISGRSYCVSCGEVCSPPHQPAKTLQDVGVRARAVSARPAASLHDRTKMAKGGVLDLRAPTATAAVITKTRKLKTAAISKTTQPQSRTALAPDPYKSSQTRSQSISRFHTPDAPAAKPQTVTTAAQVPANPPLLQLPPHAETHHRAMSKLIANQNPKRPTPPTPLSRYASVAAAVAIMASYVWWQNYPKLELQSASSKAGFALTLPAYIPSSFALKGPVTATNGAAIISFSSPSSSSPLTITQKRTSWDSSSLRDNVVATADPSYTAVEGQGLTIYLWGKNQAAWVNHGIWYGIEGTAKLSREQILKIAYSL